MTRYADLDILRRAIAGSDVRIPDEAGRCAPAQHSTAPTEHDEQVALIAACEATYSRHPELRLLFAIPNGGQRNKATAGRLKAEGVRAGVPDLFLPIARGGYHGLFIELKRAHRSNHQTPAQRVWMELLMAQGYHCVVAYGAAAALESIMNYLERPSDDQAA